MIENHKICTDFYGSLRICIVLSDFLFGVKGRIGEVTLPHISPIQPYPGNAYSLSAQRNSQLKLCPARKNGSPPILLRKNTNA